MTVESRRGGKSSAASFSSSSSSSSFAEGRKGGAMEKDVRQRGPSQMYKMEEMQALQQSIHQGRHNEEKELEQTGIEERDDEAETNNEEQQKQKPMQQKQKPVQQNKPEEEERSVLQNQRRKGQGYDTSEDREEFCGRRGGGKHTIRALDVKQAEQQGGEDSEETIQQQEVNKTQEGGAGGGGAAAAAEGGGGAAAATGGEIDPLQEYRLRHRMQYEERRRKEAEEEQRLQRLEEEAKSAKLAEEMHQEEQRAAAVRLAADEEMSRQLFAHLNQHLLRHRGQGSEHADRALQDAAGTTDSPLNEWHQQLIRQHREEQQRQQNYDADDDE